MSLTPRQVVAYLELFGKLDRIDRRSNLVITAIGSQGDSKAIDKLARELSK